MIRRRCMAGVTLAAWLGLCNVSATHAKDTGLVFVSNERSSEIFMLNGNDDVVGSFKTCARPRGMQFTPDHTKLVVACGGDDTIALYDVTTQKLVHRFRGIPDPETFALHPNGHDLYVSNEDNSRQRFSTSKPAR